MSTELDLAEEGGGQLWVKLVQTLEYLKNEFSHDSLTLWFLCVYWQYFTEVIESGRGLFDTEGGIYRQTHVTYPQTVRNGMFTTENSLLGRQWSYVVLDEKPNYWLWESVPLDKLCVSIETERIQPLIVLSLSIWRPTHRDCMLMLQRELTIEWTARENSSRSRSEVRVHDLHNKILHSCPYSNTDVKKSLHVVFLGLKVNLPPPPPPRSQMLSNVEQIWKKCSPYSEQKRFFLRIWTWTSTCKYGHPHSTFSNMETRTETVLAPYVIYMDPVCDIRTPIFMWKNSLQRRLI